MQVDEVRLGPWQPVKTEDVGALWCHARAVWVEVFGEEFVQGWVYAAHPYIQTPDEKPIPMRGWALSLEPTPSWWAATQRKHEAWGENSADLNAILDATRDAIERLEQ